MKKHKEYKVSSTLFYLASVLFYISAICPKILGFALIYYAENKSRRVPAPFQGDIDK